MNELELEDTGTIMHVPEDQRLEVDDSPPGEINADQYADLAGVPLGEVVTLSTAEGSE